MMDFNTKSDSFHSKMTDVVLKRVDLTVVRACGVPYLGHGKRLSWESVHGEDHWREVRMRAASGVRRVSVEIT